VGFVVSVIRKGTKEQAVERVLLENYDRYYRMAYSYVHNPDDACDIVQNGAYKAVLKCGSLKKTEYAATWVYRIMINEVFSFCRSSRACLSLEDAGADCSAEDSYTDFDLQSALELLPEADKAVVQLRYFEGLKLEEIAEMLDENLSTVKSRLYRSLKKLRLELGD